MNKYREVIAGLRELATRLEKDPVLGLDTDGRPWLRLDILPGVTDDDEATINAVDTLSRALFDRPGTTVGSKPWYHTADGAFGPIHVSVSGQVSDPTERDLRAELDRLRAQLAERGTV